MPIYEYECKKCHFYFEELKSFSDDSIIECPECGGEAKRLISTGAGLIFKGSGFYITDYVRNKKTETPERKTETKKEDSSKETKSTADTTVKAPEEKKSSKDE